MREICGYTQQYMASELGIGDELYAKYEEYGDDIPISALYRIAHVLKVDMAALMTGRAPRLDTYTVVPAGQGVKIERFPGYHFHSLAHTFMNKIMEPMIVTVEPCDGDPGLVTHRGQEFNYVLQGSVTVIFDDKRGDAIYFNPAYPHGQKAQMEKIPMI
jgi:transcriptional regulator with XRE-family HTH domain